MDKDTIKKIADVARLNLTDEEYAKFGESFEDILGHFSELHKEYPGNSDDDEGATNVLRKDETRLDSDVAKKIMDNAPQKENNLYKVPKGSK